MLILLKNLLKSLSKVQANVLLAYIYNALHSIMYVKFAPGKTHTTIINMGQSTIPISI
jgi:hypothetical protein